MIEIKCARCGRSRAIFEYKKLKKNYCSRKCCDKAKIGVNLSKIHAKKISKALTGRKCPLYSGELHNNWKGDNCGYSSLHNWIRKQKGQPSFCEHCLSTEKRKYEWANISGKYKRDIKDFIRLCTSCHRIFDHKKNKSSIISVRKEGIFT